MCGPTHLEPCCGKPENLCPAWKSWTIAVQDGRLVDVTATAKPLGFVEPVALSARLWDELHPGAPPQPPGGETLTALLTQAFQIIHLCHTTDSCFSFRLARPGPDSGFLSVFLTSQAEHEQHPLVFFCRGEVPWLPPPPCPERPRCGYVEEVYGFFPPALHRTIGRNHL